jgi:ABC-type sulfate/molybdate transport systems ATPase subunit
VQELSHGLRLENLMQRRPGGLSGGERQRVALGRALAAHPSVLLLDEPFSALDSESRHELRELLMRLRIAHGLTMLHVTHDAADCESLGTQVFELADGQVRPKPG